MPKGRPRKKKIELPPIDHQPTLRDHTEEVIAKAASDDTPWTTTSTTPQEVAKKVRKAGKKQMTPAQIANLRQFSNKPHDPEAKRRSMENLRTPVTQVTLNGETHVAPLDENSNIIIPEGLNEQYLREVLGHRELVYFVDRWNSYMKEHEKDFNRAEDSDDLQELIFCYIKQMRMEKKKASNPLFNFRADFSKIEQDTSLRIQALKTSLGTRRKDRLENNERKQSAFMTLVTSLAKDQASIREALEKRVLDTLEEEEAIARKLTMEVVLE